MGTVSMRLIDADALIDWIDMGHLRNPLETCYSERDVVDMLESRPTVDAKPVVHGRWVWGKNSMNQYGAWCTKCECGWEDKGNDFDRVQGLVIAHKYCPNCGAKMDGDGNG